MRMKVVSLSVFEQLLRPSSIFPCDSRLRYTELQNLALTTMIDIAEEQGIRIRKKSGAKQ